MKKIKVAIVIILCLCFTCSTIQASAAIYRKTTTHYYSCMLHDDCMNIVFVSEGNTVTGDIYDVYFSGHDAHWPNAFTYGNTWSYKIGDTGYAKGTYTFYSSLITQWASLAFKSSSETCVHVY